MSSKVIFPLLIGVFCALLVYLRLTGPITLTYDSWVYWEAASSIRDGKGYTQFNGNPVISWPPLFPILLAGWGLLFDLSISSIKWLFVMLAFISGILWMSFFKSLNEHGPNINNWLAALVIVCSIPEFYSALLSETLWLPILGLLLYVIASQNKFADYNISGWLKILVSCTALLLCRNQSVVLIPGLLLFFILLFGVRKGTFRAIALVVSVFFWLVCRSYLNQLGSHTDDIGHGGFWVQIPEIIAMTPSLFSITIFSIDKLAIFVVLTFIVVVFYTLSLNWNLQTEATKPLRKAAGLLILGLSIWAGTYMAATSMGAPAAQPRWYKTVALFITIAAILMTSDNTQKKLVRLTAIGVILIVLPTYIYRISYFTKQLSFSNIENPVTSTKFSPSWVNIQIKEIKEQNNRGISVEEAVKGRPYSANTFRRWTNQKLK